MRTVQRQTVGRFVFDDDAATRNPSGRPRAFPARHGADSVATLAVLLAIAIATATLWCLGL